MWSDRLPERQALIGRPRAGLSAQVSAHATRPDYQYESLRSRDAAGGRGRGQGLTVVRRAAASMPRVLRQPRPHSLIESGQCSTCGPHLSGTYAGTIRCMRDNARSIYTPAGYPTRIARGRSSRSATGTPAPRSGHAGFCTSVSLWADEPVDLLAANRGRRRLRSCLARVSFLSLYHDAMTASGRAGRRLARAGRVRGRSAPSAAKPSCSDPQATSA